jgi:hypothetical protein
MTISDNLDRRYLLGNATDEDREALERAYFTEPAALERVEAAEERLIEAYLAGELDPRERERFEREYLASPTRRRHVEIVRRLAQPAAAAAAPSRSRWTGTYLPLAASLLIAVLAGWWFIAFRTVSPTPDSKDRSTSTQPAPPAVEHPGAAAARAPENSAGSLRFVALALSPISTRSAGETPTVTVRSGIDAVRLDLQGDGTTDAPFPHARVVVQTVSGRTVWEGDAERTTDVPAPAARVMIPAPHLETDDYVIILLAADTRGAEQERHRYFFRVRVR